MKKSLVFATAALLLSSVSPSLRGDAKAGTVDRLCAAVTARKQLQVDTDQAEVIWSDGALFEAATEFPAPLQKLLVAATTKRDLSPLLARFAQMQKTDWLDAKLDRDLGSRDQRTVKSADGTVTLSVSSTYLDYLEERYPDARIRVKGEFQPVLFLVGDTVRAAVMPLRSPAK